MKCPQGRISSGRGVESSYEPSGPFRPGAYLGFKTYFLSAKLKSIRIDTSLKENEGGSL